MTDVLDIFSYLQSSLAGLFLVAVQAEMKGLRVAAGSDWGGHSTKAPRG
jgi:hypothetical protein